MSAPTTNPSETQPLLSTAVPPTYHDSDEPPLIGGSDEESNSTLVAPDNTRIKKAKYWSIVAFQVYVVCKCLIVLGLFIRGFILMGDVEVRFSLGRALAGRHSLVDIYLVRL